MLSILFGATLVVAGSTTGSATCDASGCTSCVTADGSLASTAVCVNYTAPPPPTCVGCNNLCPMTACLNLCDTTCNICVPSTLGLAGVCFAATTGTGLILASKSSLSFGIDFSAFAGSGLVNLDASASADFSLSGSVIVNWTKDTLSNVTLGGGITTSAIVQLNTSTSVGLWTNNAGNSKVDNECNNLTIGKLEVGGASFAVFQGCPKANVTLSSIDFSARATLVLASKLEIAGGMAHVNLDGQGTITGQGTLSLSGGVAIDGSVPAGVTVDVRAASNAPLVSIDANKQFQVAGDMKAGAAGTVAVYGKLAFGAATSMVDPKVIVNAGATLVFNSTSTCNAKVLDVAAGATLVIGANVKSGTLAVEQFTKCLGAVQINLATSASAFISGTSAGTAVAFTYTTGNPTELAQCKVTVIDQTGAVITLTSRTSASTGRRLLQDGGTATWGDRQMTYTMGEKQASGAMSAILAPVVVGFLVLFA